MTNAMRWPSSAKKKEESVMCRENIDGEELVADVAEEEIERPQPQPQPQHRKQSCCQKFGDRFPRIFAITFGVILPVCGLVLLSCVFGYWIAQIESPVEILQNDNVIASYTITARKIQILSNLTSVSPKICFNLFLNNVTVETLIKSSLVDILYEGIEEEQSSTDDDGTSIETLHRLKVRYESIADDTVPDIYNNSQAIDEQVNIMHLYNFLQLCGDKFRSFIYNETGLTILPQSEESATYDTITLPALYFSWNRCTPFKFLEVPNFIHSLHPSNQTKYYLSAWENDTIRLYDYYYDYYTLTWNVSSAIASSLAQQQSIEEATGEAACDVNMFSGGMYRMIAHLQFFSCFCVHLKLIFYILRAPTAWFWFTIMSTIGYVSTK